MSALSARNFAPFVEVHVMWVCFAVARCDLHPHAISHPKCMLCGCARQSLDLSFACTQFRRPIGEYMLCGCVFCIRLGASFARTQFRLRKHVLCVCVFAVARCEICPHIISHPCGHASYMVVFCSRSR